MKVKGYEMQVILNKRDVDIIKKALTKQKIISDVKTIEEAREKLTIERLLKEFSEII